MAANHEEFLEALKVSTHRVSTEANQRWLIARNGHPLYAHLTETRATEHDLDILKQIHKDIEALRDAFMETLTARTNAWNDYYDFIDGPLFSDV